MKKEMKKKKISFKERFRRFLHRTRVADYNGITFRPRRLARMVAKNYAKQAGWKEVNKVISDNWRSILAQRLLGMKPPKRKESA